MYLVRANAILTLIEQVRGVPPFSERNLRAFKDGADRDGELAATLVAIVEAGAMGFLLAADARNLIGIAVFAMRANRTIGPAHGF